MADWTPQSRAEEILFKTINGEPYDGLPQSRIEELLLELKDAIESGGGGGGGTDNYNSLKNLPQINGQTVKGNMSGTTLGLVNMVMGKDLSTNDYTNADKAIVNSVTADLAGKVDKVTGKGLSENDYTDADKAIVGGVTSALSDKVDKVAGKGLSTNDYDDTAKGIVDGVTSALAGKVSTSSVGSANGVAELDANGKVPSSQLPSYVDDVLEYADLAHFPATGETGKIYIAEDTNKTYRWSGSDYAEISESLALGETSSTAYAGNKGKANTEAIEAIKDGANIDSFGDVETALAGKADVSALADYASLDNSGAFPDANSVNKELVYINGFQSVLTNYPLEVSNTVGILFTRWFYYSGDLTVPRMQLVFTLTGKSFCRFFDGTTWTPWISNSVSDLSNLTTTNKSSVVDAINELDGKIGNLSTGILRFYPIVAQNDIAAVSPPKANSYSIVSLTILGYNTEIPEATGGVTDGYIITAKSTTDRYLHIGLVGSYASVNKGKCLNLVLDIT